LFSFFAVFLSKALAEKWVCMSATEEIYLKFNAGFFNKNTIKAQAG
jgi:hypothetical protein